MSAQWCCPLLPLWLPVLEEAAMPPAADNSSLDPWSEMDACMGTILDQPTNTVPSLSPEPLLTDVLPDMFTHGCRKGAYCGSAS